MSAQVELIVEMKEEKVDTMNLFSTSGERIARLDRDALFKNMKDMKHGICVIYEDENTAVYADANCDLIKLDAWLWANEL